MNFRGKAWDLIKWRVMKDRLGYTDEEMKVFRENPRNGEVLSRVPEWISKTVVMTVVESHGCNSQHRVGDKLYFDGAGNIIARRCPEKICAYAVHAATPLLYACNEMFHAGMDPNEMKFRRTACIDVGLQCGGWGRVVFELAVQDR